MIWIFLLFSTIWFGYEFLPFLKVHEITFLPRLLCGWLLGSISISFLLYFTSFIIPINFFHSLLFIIILPIGSIYLRKKSRPTQFQFEKNPFFYSFIFFVTGISLKYLSSIYGSLPESGPYNMKPTLDSEISFLYSLLKGCNKRRRNPFFFSDPRISDFHYTGYSLPLLYTALLMAGGSSYSDASISICYLNILSSSVAIYYICKQLTHYPAISATLFLFQGSWAPIRLLQGSKRIIRNNDLVHTISIDENSIFSQPLAQILSFSKSHSFAFALAQFSILHKHHFLGILFTFLVPSCATAFALNLFFLSCPSFNIHIVHFFPLIYTKLIPFLWHYFPLFREAEMRGTFFAPLVIWYVGIGPLFILLLLFGWHILVHHKQYDKSLFHSVIAAITPFLILQLFREGRDCIENSLAITSVCFLPFICFVVELLAKFTKWPKDEEYQGCMTFIAFGFVAFLILGGLICIHRETNMKTSLFDEYKQEIAEVINENTKEMDVILIRAELMNPAIFTGRQLFLGDLKEIWKTGANVKEKIHQYSTFIKSNVSLNELKTAQIKLVVDDMENRFPLDMNLTCLKKNYLYRVLRVEY